MRRITLVAVLFASVFLFRTAESGPSRGFEGIVRIAKASITVPTEWDGIWATRDSLFACDGTLLLDLGADTDTLCGGKDYSQGAYSNYDCTGTADPNTYDVTCTGSEPVSADCTANYTNVTHGTRTGTTYYTVTTINATYTGTNCDPPACFELRSHGTYTGPAPTVYCATPTKASTWGQIKALYR